MQRRHLKIFFVLFCIAGSFLIGLMTLFDPSTAPAENRKPAPFPPLRHAYQTPRKFIYAYEAWLSDAIHFRKTFMRTHNTWRAYFNISPQKAVILGKEGWLFYRSEGALEDYRNSELLTETELQQWRLYLLYHHEYAKQHGAHFVFFVAPGKEKLYREFLPDHITQLSSTSRFDQVLSIIKDTPVTVLDLRPTMEQAKQGGQIYNKTDTHWNLVGAYYAYVELLELLQKQFPDLEIKHYARTDFVEVEGKALAGTGVPYDTSLTVALAGVARYRNEKRFLYTHAPTACIEETETAVYDTWRALPGSRKAKQFRVTQCKTGHHRVLMLRDSFADILLPFLSSTFNYTAYFWLPHPWDNASWIYFIDALKPDIILEEMAETYLELVPQPGVDYPADFRPADF